MISKIDFTPRRSIFALFLVFILVYALFEARFLILGPSVEFTSHHDHEIVTLNMITLTGQAENIAHITLNGHQIFTDADGRWSERVALSGGESIMTVEVRDRFKREASDTIRLFLN